jgi:hypothetical protein
MSSIKSTSILALFVFLTGLAVGCAQSEPVPPAMEPQERDLNEILGMYRMYLKSHGQQPPQKLSDLMQARGIHGNVMQALKQGKYVVVWGVKDHNADTMLAYEKDAPAKGGWAVMADGKIKRLDASAFQNVPKPGT